MDEISQDEFENLDETEQRRLIYESILKLRKRQQEKDEADAMDRLAEEQERAECEIETGKIDW